MQLGCCANTDQIAKVLANLSEATRAFFVNNEMVDGVNDPVTLKGRQKILLISSTYIIINIFYIK